VLLLLACTSPPSDTSPVRSAPFGEDTAPVGSGPADSAPPDTERPPVDTGPTSDAVQASVITTTTPVAGDFDCYRPGGTCQSFRAYDDCVETRSLQGSVVDETGAALGGATVEHFWGDWMGKEADSTVIAASDGVLTGARVPTCTPHTVRVSGDNASESLDLHVVHPFEEGDITADVVGWSDQARDTFAAAFGTSFAADRGVVLGTITDCAGEPLAHVQVIALDEHGDYPAGQHGHFFEGDMPSPGATATDAQGRFLLADVPPGYHVLEAWAAFEGHGTEVFRISFADMEIVEGGLVTLPLQTGVQGAVFPDACLVACGA